jgi:PAS domain S-box-containing protein
VGEPGERKVAILFKDITERKQAEEKIRLIIDTVPGLLWTARPDGWVDFLNQRWLDYTGMTLEQGLGWAWQPGYHPDDLGNVLSKWRAALAEGKPLDVEARLRRFDGEYRWFLKRAFPLFDRAGRVLGWYGGNIDIHDLKQAEEKLRRIDTYLSEGQRMSRTGSWAWSVKTKENLFWSREHYRIFGFDPDTESGRYEVARERIHPADLRAFDENLNRAVQEQKDFEIDFRILLPGGELKHVHNLGHPVFNNSGELVEFIGTTMDVTERKQAEETLRRSENYLAEAQRLSHTGSWARSLATDEITYWSEECYRVLGFEPHDGLPHFEKFLQHVHPDDQAKVKEISERAARGEAEYEVDYRIVHPGGQLRDIHAIGHPAFSPSGDLVEYVGTVIDVTERKRAQLLLAGENRLLEMITKGEARELVLNALCQLVEELSNGSMSSILLLDPITNQLRHGGAPSLPAAYVEAIDGAVIGPRVGSCGTAAYRAEPVIVSDIATDPLWVDYRDLALSHGLRACWSTPILSSAGKVLGTFAIYYRERRSPTALDHSVIGRVVHLASIAVEREQAEAALRQAQADLAHVSRVTTMGEMTASIAHEVNQPLAAVVNNANACISLLPDGGPGLEDVREALAEIIDDAERASNVIARVRQLARKAPVERTPLDLRDVIAEVLALARHESATRRVTIHTEIPREPSLVLGDRVQLQQVLLNLIVNGMDAMNTVEESKRVLMICGHCETRDGRLENLVSVQDAGTGFKPEQMNRLFEAFYTTKPHGMGMGLAISRSIIEAHGGRLWAEANQGPGATFLLRLPAAGSAAS